MGELANVVTETEVLRVARRLRLFGLLVSVILVLGGRAEAQNNRTNLYQFGKLAPSPSGGSVAAGDLMYNTNTSGIPGRLAGPSGTGYLLYWNNTTHKPDYGLYGTVLAIPTCEDSAGKHLNWTGSAWVCGTTSGLAGSLAGDVVGASAANTVAKLQGDTLTLSGRTSGQAIVWNGSAWVPATIDTSGLANRQLSNLTSPTLINQDLLSVSGAEKLGSDGSMWVEAWAKVFYANGTSGEGFFHARNQGSAPDCSATSHAGVCLYAVAGQFFFRNASNTKLGFETGLLTPGSDYTNKWPALNGKTFATIDGGQTFSSATWNGSAIAAAYIGAHASTHKHGGSDEIATATAGANQIPKADGTGKLDPGWIPGATGGATGQIASVVAVDPNLSMGSYYAWTADHSYIQLKPLTTWATNADCKASAPAGWTWESTSHLSACDANTTTSAALHIVHKNEVSVTTGSDLNIQPALYKVFPYAPSYQTWIMREAIPSGDFTNSNRIFAGPTVLDDSSAASQEWARIDIVYNGGSPLIRWISHNALVTSAAVTTGNAGNGIWMALVKYAGGFGAWYSTTVSSTPPTSWTFLGSSTGTLTLANGTHPMRVSPGGPMCWQSACGGTFASDILYWDDSGAVGDPSARTPFDGSGTLLACGTGCDGSAAAHTLIADRTIGATTTLSNADVQAVLTEVTNTRATATGAALDTGTATFCLVRSSGTPSFGGCSYAAAASATVSGSGAHLGVAWKCSSDGTTQCSLSAGRLLFPIN